MPLPFSLFRKKDIACDEGLESVRSLFSKFRRIQKLNTRALEKMAEMERALGGEYIFDRAFLESSVLELAKTVHQVVYSLNAMTENRYANIFARFQAIRGSLEDILDGGPGPFGQSLTLSYKLLGWDLEPLVGAWNVCIAEAANSLGLPAPDGFAVTVNGCRILMEREAGAGMAFPPDLESSIVQETEALLGRIGRPSLFTVVPCPAGDYRGKLPELPGAREVQPEDILSAVAEALHEYRARIASCPEGIAPWSGSLRETSSGSAKTASRPEGFSPPVALAVHESVHSFVTGTLAGIPSAEYPAGLFRVDAAPAGSPDCAETYLVRKTYPYNLVQSQIRAKGTGTDIYPGVTPLSRDGGRLARGSALLKPKFLTALVERAATMERILGGPFELQWAANGADRPVITGARHLPDREDPVDCELSSRPEGTKVLLRGGDMVQAGIAAGRITLITGDPDVQRIPRGAIAVARAATPNLSPILPRISALVTEVGSSIGHLATVARELRVPAIFGARGAIGNLPEGIEVTVDAGERTVYAGIVEPLLACHGQGTDLYPDDPEYVTLRGLLRWIMPLNLTGPESGSITVEDCRTLHDLLHFAHEKSVAELLHIQDHRKGIKGLDARRLDLKTPIELFLLDLGGGLTANAGRIVRPDEIASVPLRAFVRGLEAERMWDRKPVPIRLKDIFSGLDRTRSAMAGSLQHGGGNHAIIASNYMNVGLRLGYHFSVIDCYLGENVNRNYIYFRFAGGLADANQRRRRAGLIASVLEGLYFKVRIEGDLVIGKLKMGEAADLSATLAYIGELTAFTRQLDVVMKSDDAAERLLGDFIEKSSLDSDRGREHALD